MGGTSPDWSASNTNKLIYGIKYPNQRVIIIDLTTRERDTTSLAGYTVRWAPSGNHVIMKDIEGWYIININGTNKWYLQP